MADKTVEVEVTVDGMPADAGAGRVVRALGRIKSASAGVTRAVTGLMRAFGWIGLAVRGVQTLVSAWKKLSSWLGKVAAANREMARQNHLSRWTRELDATAKAAERLAGNMKDAAAAMREANDLADMDKAASRAADDAKLALDEQREMAGAQDDDARAAVADKYALRRADLAQQRAYDDAADQEKRLRAEADGHDKAAADWDAIARRMEAAAKDLTRDVSRTTGDEKEKFRQRRDAALAAAKEARGKSEDETRAASAARARADRASAPAVAASAAADAERQRVANAAARRDQELAKKNAEEKKRKDKEALDKARAEEDARLDLEEQKRLAGAGTDKERADVSRAFKRRRIEIAGARAKEDDDAAAGIAAQADLLADENAVQQSALRADTRPAALATTDRIAQLGGFSTAGAAAVTGLSAGTSPELAEMRKLSDNAAKLLEELRAINRNTRGERAAVFG